MTSQLGTCPTCGSDDPKIRIATWGKSCPNDDFHALCLLCGEPMPKGEKAFKYHGYSGPCPVPLAPVSPEKPEQKEWALWAAEEVNRHAMNGNRDSFEMNLSLAAEIIAKCHRLAAPSTEREAAPKVAFGSNSANDSEPIDEPSKPLSEASVRVLNSILESRVPESSFYRDSDTTTPGTLGLDSSTKRDRAVAVLNALEEEQCRLNKLELLESLEDFGYKAGQERMRECAEKWAFFGPLTKTAIHSLPIEEPKP